MHVVHIVEEKDSIEPVCGKTWTPPPNQAGTQLYLCPSCRITIFQYGRQDKLVILAETMSIKSNLPFSICAAMLRHGWTFVEDLDGASRWDPPIAAFQKRIRHDEV